MNLKRILADTDVSSLGDTAIHRAIVLAAREESELLILHAKPSVPDDVLLAATATYPRGCLPWPGAAIRCRSIWRTKWANLFVVGKHGSHIAEELLLGRVPRHVRAESQCDVLVIFDPRAALGEAS
jgi:nucleotide-binding universal stress UspA family protein